MMSKAEWNELQWFQLSWGPRTCLYCKKEHVIFNKGDPFFCCDECADSWAIKKGCPTSKWAVIIAHGAGWEWCIEHRRWHDKGCGKCKRKPMAKQYVLVRKNLRHSSCRCAELTHSTSGYEIAGSGTRWTDEKWGVLTLVGGDVHGQWFKTFSEAKATFEHWTRKDLMHDVM